MNIEIVRAFTDFINSLRDPRDVQSKETNVYFWNDVFNKDGDWENFEVGYKETKNVKVNGNEKPVTFFYVLYVQINPDAEIFSWEERYFPVDDKDSEEDPHILFLEGYDLKHKSKLGYVNQVSAKDLKTFIQKIKPYIEKGHNDSVDAHAKLLSLLR